MIYSSDQLFDVRFISIIWLEIQIFQICTRFLAIKVNFENFTVKFICRKMGGKQKGVKKDGSKDDGGHLTSSTGAGASAGGNMKEIEPHLKSFLQIFPQFQSRWNEGWTDQTQLLNELKADVKKQFDELRDEQLHLKVSVGFNIS